MYNNLKGYNDFENIFTNILQRHAPLKTKFVRANNKPHISKDLRKAIMKRSKLKALANKTKYPEDVANYKQQRNLVVRLNKQAKKAYFNSTNRKTKHFWDAFKPKFSEKAGAIETRIQLLEKNILHTDSESIANTFNIYFNRITEQLDIPNWETQTLPFKSDDENTLIPEFEKDPSIKVIKSYQTSLDQFEFSNV